MSYSQRWKCSCGAKNTWRMQSCYRCGAAPLEQFVLPETNGGKSAAPPRKPLPRWWPIGAAVAALLGSLWIGGIAMMLHGGGAPAGSPIEQDRIFKYHQADVRGKSEDGKNVIRCVLCQGRGEMPHFSYIGGEPKNLTEALQRGYVDRYIICPECGGIGRIHESRATNAVLVPDSEASSYSP